MALTKIREKNQVTLPDTVRTAAGLKVGDLLDATVVRGGVLLRAKAIIDKVELDRRLGEAEADYKAGRTIGPFKTASATMRALKQRARARRS